MNPVTGTISTAFLTTKNLWLRGLELADVDDDYLAVVNDDETSYFMGSSQWPGTQASLRAHAERSLQEPNAVHLVIVRRQDGARLGFIRLFDINWLHRRAEVGTLIARRYWNQGYAREARYALVKYAFERLNLSKVFAQTHDAVRNVRSWTALGFEVEGRMREHSYFRGSYWDTVLLGIRREAFVNRPQFELDSKEITR